MSADGDTTDQSGAFGPSNPTATDDQTTATGFSPYLAQQRQKYFDEMDADPHLKGTVQSLLMHENGGDPTGVLESMVNRADAAGTSIRKQVYGGFYGPINRGAVGEISPSQQSVAASAYDNVRNGSNVIDLRTDQGMVNEHKWADSVADQGRGRKASINGEWYSDYGPTGEGWANGTRAAMLAAGETGMQTPTPQQRSPMGAFGGGTQVARAQPQVGNLGAFPIGSPTPAPQQQAPVQPQQQPAPQANPQQQLGQNLMAAIQQHQAMAQASLRNAQALGKQNLFNTSWLNTATQPQTGAFGTS